MKRTAILPLLWFAVIIGASAQISGHKTINGRVFLASNNAPAKMVRVNLENEFGNVLATTVTNVDGRFSFNDLESKVYNVTTELDGYQPERQTVDMGYRGEEADCTFFLRALAGSHKPVTVGSPSLADKAQKSLADGQQLMSEKRYKDAIVPLSAAVAAAPTYAPAYNELGNAYFGSGDKQMAEKQWQQALRIDPKQSSALINLARLANDRHDSAAALDYLDRATQAGGDSWPLHLERGRALYAQSKWQDASTELDQALKAGGSSEPQIYIMLANLDVKAHLYPQARHMFEEYLRTDPNGSFAPRARQIVQDMIAKGIPEPPPQ